MGRGFVRFLNGLVSLAVGLSLLIAGAYAGYCLWDNHQIYAAAENVQDDMIQLKPKIDENAEEEGPSFAELLRVNQDVKAWLTLDHTQIDYPVLQGEDNEFYLGRDANGRVSKWGCLFADCRAELTGREELSRNVTVYGYADGERDAGGKLFSRLVVVGDDKPYSKLSAKPCFIYGGNAVVHGDDKRNTLFV